jgi:hypothetical protein
VNQSTTHEPAASGRDDTPDGNTVVRFTPIPPQPRSGSGAAGRELPPELTYGCVDWFDYKNHPLQVAGETAAATMSPEAGRR